MKATRRFVDRRLKSYCEEMNLFVGERDEREKKVKRMKDPENPGKWEDRRFVLDTKLRQLFQTPDDIDQLSFRKRTKAEEEGEFSDGVAPVSLLLDPHFVDITDQDASQLVQSKTYGSNVIVKKNNSVRRARISAEDFVTKSSFAERCAVCIGSGRFVPHGTRGDGKNQRSRF